MHKSKIAFILIMDKQVIRSEAKQLRNLKDLADLINKIGVDEFGVLKHRISEEQLKHFSLASISPKRYKTFQISKKSGGQREINAPCKQLALLLYLINILLKSVYIPHPAVMGFTEGRSVADNARMHIGHHYVFNIDLKDFFSSIPQARVWKRLQLPPFNFPQSIANVLAGLCCHTNAEGTCNVLPQGAATSPLLSNAICDNLDRRLCGVAKRFGLHYSRYADDVTFSSMHNVYNENSDFRLEIQRVIEGQGFTMNERKTRLLRDGRRQEVTGLTVNKDVNVSRKYISDLRWILRVWEKEGYAKAYSKFYPKYKKEKGYIKKGEPIMENVIGGKLNYLRMVKGTTPSYKKLQDRFNKLQQMVYVDNETDDNQSYIYVLTYPIKDFLDYFSTSISLKKTAKNSLTAQCVLAGMDKCLSISKSTQKSLCPNIEVYAQDDEIFCDKLSNCFVTLCRSKGKNFWLITEFEPKRSLCLSVQNANIDIDVLLNIWENEGLEKAVTMFHYLLSEKNHIELTQSKQAGAVYSPSIFISDEERQRELSTEKSLTPILSDDIQEVPSEVESFSTISEDELKNPILCDEELDF